MLLSLIIILTILLLIYYASAIGSVIKFLLKIIQLPIYLGKRLILWLNKYNKSELYRGVLVLFSATVFILFIIYVWPTRYRYERVQNHLIRIDRISNDAKIVQYHY